MATVFQAAFEAAKKPVEKNREEQVTPKAPVLSNIPRRPVLPQKKKPTSKNPTTEVLRRETEDVNMTKPAKNQQVQQVKTEEVNAMSTQEENNHDVQVVEDIITQSPEAADSASLDTRKREKRMSELFKKYGGVDLVSNDSPSFTLEVEFT